MVYDEKIERKKRGFNVKFSETMEDEYGYTVGDIDVDVETDMLGKIKKMKISGTSDDAIKKGRAFKDYWKEHAQNIVRSRGKNLSKVV